MSIVFYLPLPNHTFNLLYKLWTLFFHFLLCTYVERKEQTHYFTPCIFLSIIFFFYRNSNPVTNIKKVMWCYCFYFQHDMTCTIYCCTINIYIHNFSSVMLCWMDEVSLKMNNWTIELAFNAFIWQGYLSINHKTSMANSLHFCFPFAFRF